MPTKRKKCVQCRQMFTPTFDTKTVRQLVCSNKCCLAYYEKQPKKSKRLAREVAKMIGKRSIGEIRFSAEHLDVHKNLDYEYEADTFEFRVEETRKYTPDFTLVIRKPTKKTKGKIIYIEYKGVLDQLTRKKMLLVKKQYPTLDIRLVFQRGKNKIYKGSKTTYMDWAKQHGFICADNEVPPSWLK